MESRDSVPDFEWVCILTISFSYDLHSHCGQNSLSTGVRKKVNRESPILKARLFILQEFSTTESTKGTKMKTSENFVISVPFVVKNLSFHRSE